MAHYSMDSRLKPEQVLRKAESFFGAGGVGLDMTALDGGCLYFKGGGGHVSITASEEEYGSVVDLETTEWDYQVRAFMRKVAR